MQPLRDRAHALLRWSERYMKTDMVYLANGAFWLSLGQFFSSVSSFVLSIAFANLLPPTTYGIYKYAVTLSGIIGSFSLGDLGTGILQAVARGYEGVLRRGFWVNLMWSIPMVLISLGGATYYFVLGNLLLAATFLIIGATTPLFMSGGLYPFLFYGRKDFKTLTHFQVYRAIVPVLALLVTLTLTKDPLWFIVVYFFSNTSTVLLLYYITLRFYRPNDAYDPHALTYGKHLSVIHIIDTVADNLDKVLIFHYLGAAELAVYSFAIAMPEQIKAYFGSVTDLVLPRFSARSMHEIRSGVWHKMLQFFIVSAVIVCAYMIAAPFIFTLFFHNYISAILYSQIYALSLLPVAFKPTDVALVAKRRTYDQYLFSLITSVFQIAVVIIFIFVWGLMGLVLARISTRFFAGIMSYYFYTRIPVEA